LIRKNVEEGLGKSFSPKYIVHLDKLPKTRNGKILRRILKKAFTGESIGDTSNMEDQAIIKEVSEKGIKLRGTIH
jgi:acetyl-CoA synthetase